MYKEKGVRFPKCGKKEKVVIVNVNIVRKEVDGVLLVYVFHMTLIQKKKEKKKMKNSS